MKINRKTLIFSFITLCLVTAFLELLLLLLTAVSPPINELLSLKSPRTIPNAIPDERLGHRPNPELPDHDSRGFRNPTVPEKAEIVILGDSQTYGVGVKSQDAWPRQLESLIGVTVYNMAYGGYGPAHCLILFEEAANFNPDIYIVAFYSGNDLFDSYSLVYTQNQLPYLKTSDEETIQNMEETEKAEPIAQHFATLYQMRKARTTVKEKTTSSKQGGAIGKTKSFLRSHFRLYRLGSLAKRKFILCCIKNAVWMDIKKRAEMNSDYCEVFEGEQYRTIFTSEYRLNALSLEDSRIAEGFRISLESLKRMDELSRQENRRFIVALIPTKELVFKELVKNPAPIYRNLIEHEERLWELTKEFLGLHGIDYVDTLPGLKDLLNRGIQPYKESGDGHPNKQGHKAIAELVYKRVLQ